MFKPLRNTVVCSLFLAVLLLPGFAFSGTVAAYRFVGPGDSPSAPPGVFIYDQGEKLRVDIKVQPWNASLLFDRSTKVLTVLDNVLHTYDDYGSAKRMMIRSSLGVALRVNDMRLKDGNEADQKLRDQLARAIHIVFNSKFQKTASDRKINQWTVDLYDGKKGYVQLSAAAMSKDKAMPNAQDWETWKEFMQILLETGRGGLEYFGAEESNLDAWPGFQGFPVSMTWREGTKVVYRLQATSIETKTLKSDLFVPPATYKEQSMLDLLKGQ
jgi:hypothetical protein